MSRTMKQTLSVIHYKYKILSAAFTCFLGIAIFFIFSSNLSDLLGNYLHVHPGYTGGEIVADIITPVENSNLVRYKVHQPVTNAKWQQNAEYWQLVLDFKSGDAFSQNLKIQIALREPSEKSDAYDFEIRVVDGQCKVYDIDGIFICDTEYYSLNDDCQLKLRVPLQNKNLQRVLGVKKTWHTIIDGETKATIEVNMAHRKKSRKDKEEINSYVKHIKELYYQNVSDEDGGDAPDLENVSDCLTYYGEKLKTNPDDYLSLSYYGTSLAIKGGQSNVIKAVALVNEGFTYLDKAAELSEGKPGEIEVLMNRASVCVSVPEQVFIKSESGAENFLKIVSLTDDTLFKAYCYVMAYECYERCGKEVNAFLALQEGKKMVE